MIYGHLASLATLVKFHASTRKSILDFWPPPLLEQQIEFVYTSTNINMVKVQMKCFFLLQNLKRQQKSGRTPFTVS